MCATLSWYSLLKAENGDTTPVDQRLTNFWRDNSTQNPMEEAFNDSLVKSVQLIDKGMIPEWKISPDSFFSKTMLSASEAMLPRKDFYDFKGLLESYIDFKELKTLVKPSSPVLMLGAANVLSGEFKKFNSRKIDEIQVEAILASAAVPSIFPAVQIGKDAYWDGLFSDNPPTDELLDRDFVGENHIPDELWVIQINPKTCKTVPRTPAEIADRRNEMIGNESLFQDLKHIHMVNKFLKKRAFTKEFVEQRKLKPVDIFIIEMSQELLDNLDYSSKLNRNAKYIRHLMEDGEKQGERFLKNPSEMRHSL